MDSVKIALASLLASLGLTGCQFGYYFKSAVSQMQLLNNKIPLAEALKDPSLKESDKKKLLLSQKVREFAEGRLHLQSTKNYTSFVKLDRPYVTYVVSASPKWELKHHLWKFPFVGRMPYKGFFNEAEAKEEEASLKEQDLDTFVRGVSAYSTLGWFRDPLLSSMLSYKEYELVNTLIHETVHATIFIKNSADFNERLAVFLGNKGMEMFYLQEEGPDSPTLKIAQAENEDDKIFSEFISREIGELEKWYERQSVKDEAVRSERLRDIQQKFTREIEPRMKSQSYSKFKNLTLNNARLLMYKTYMQDLSDFESLYEQSGRSFDEFLRRCRALENSLKPEEDLKKLVSK